DPLFDELLDALPHRPHALRDLQRHRHLALLLVVSSVHLAHRLNRGSRFSINARTASLCPALSYCFVIAAPSRCTTASRSCSAMLRCTSPFAAHPASVGATPLEPHLLVFDRRRHVPHLLPWITIIRRAAEWCYRARAPCPLVSPAIRCCPGGRVRAEQAYFLIADISGYTQFLSGTELEHAQGIIEDLCGVVHRALVP